MITHDSPEAWAEVVWLIGGPAALRLHLEGKTTFDPEGYAAPGSGSALARESAAVLIGHRGGDALERAEFARLFAIGEPQEGLRAFLEKRRPSFRGMLVAENR
jgi:enoyl-CoA hydratase/carnithine racemase